MNIGIVGMGFVGSAAAHGFQNNNLFLVDPNLGTDTSLLKNQKMDAVFICVPTPMGADGSVDVSIVAKVLSELKDVDTLLVLKSTVPPNLVAEFAAEYEKFVYNPEFLTERNALWDFENPISNVYGGKLEYTKQLEQIYKHHSICKEANTFHMSATEASFVKYTMNSFLSTKVLFFNQLYDLTQSAGADFDVIKRAVANDARIGPSHMNVPGDDGNRGFSGSCFPKDVPAFVRYSIQLGQEFTVLKEVWNKNCDYRTNGTQLQREKEQHIRFNKI